MILQHNLPIPNFAGQESKGLAAIVCIIDVYCECSTHLNLSAVESLHS